MMKMRPFLIAAIVLAGGFSTPPDVDAQTRDHGNMRLVLAEKGLAVRLARMKTYEASAKLVQTRADNARGQIANLETPLDLAKKQVARLKALHSARAISLQEMEESEIKLAQANIALEAPRAAIAEAEAELELIAARKNELLAEIEEVRAGIEFLRMRITPK